MTAEEARVKFTVRFSMDQKTTCAFNVSSTMTPLSYESFIQPVLMQRVTARDDPTLANRKRPRR